MFIFRFLTVNGRKWFYGDPLYFTKMDHKERNKLMLIPDEMRSEEEVSLEVHLRW